MIYDQEHNINECAGLCSLYISGPLYKPGLQWVTHLAEKQFLKTIMGFLGNTNVSSMTAPSSSVNSLSHVA